MSRRTRPMPLGSSWSTAWPRRTLLPRSASEGERSQKQVIQRFAKSSSSATASSTKSDRPRSSSSRCSMVRAISPRGAEAESLTLPQANAIREFFRKRADGWAATLTSRVVVVCSN